MNKQTMWILVVIALFVGAFGGYYYEKTKLTKLMVMNESTLQKQVQDLQMKNDQLMKSQMTNEKMMQTTPSPSNMMMKK